MTLKAQNVELLNADEFEKQLQSLVNYQLIDVRTSEEYREAHLPHALNLNFNESDILELIDLFDRDNPIFVYCKTGRRSAEAAAKMIEMGFKNVYDLQGGITAWTKAGKPVEGRVSAKKQAKDFQDIFTMADLKKIINSQDAVLLDFYASWCIPCRKMEPALDTLAKEFDGQVLIARVNIENAKALTRELGVREIPVVNLYKSGEMMATYTGYMTQTRLRTVIKHLLE